MITHYDGQYREIAEIFHSAIYEIASQFYSPPQIAAWCDAEINYSHWQKRCEIKQPWLFILDGQVAGFLELEENGHIDCHYVHAKFNRQGIGGKLLEHAISIAQQKGWPRLFVEASHVAKGLYLKHSFVVVSSNSVQRNGQTLHNWIMERQFLGDFST